MNILMLARHFPPAISGGSRRPAMLRQGLKELGHEIFVIAPRLSDDCDGRAVSHPAELRDDTAGVSTIPVAEPRWRRWQRNYTLWPDPDRWWANKVVDSLTNNPLTVRPDLVISTSPPESIHHAASVLSQRWGVPWIGDFRDNWLTNPLSDMKRIWWRRQIELRIAKRWLSQMRLATAPTQAILDELAEMFPQARTHLMPQISSLPKARSKDVRIEVWDDLPDSSLRVLHAGSFSLSDPARRLDATLAAFQSGGSQTHLFFAGRLSDVEVEQVKNTPRAHWLGVLQRELCLSLMLEADALLVAASDGTRAEPGKLSEYANVDKPIIAIGLGPWRQALPITKTVTFDTIDRPWHGETVYEKKTNAQSVAAKLLEALCDTSKS